MPSPPAFFRLPSELRSIIYELAIAAHEGLPQPHILNVCHQTRTEAVKLFYTTYCFTFPGTASSRAHCAFVVNRWLRATGEAHARLVRWLRFELTGVPNREVLTRDSFSLEEEIDLVLDLRITVGVSGGRRIDGRIVGAVDWGFEDGMRFDMALLSAEKGFGQHGSAMRMLERVAWAVPDLVDVKVRL